MTLLNELIDSAAALSRSRFRDASTYATRHALPLAVDRRRPDLGDDTIPVWLLNEFASAVGSLVDCDEHCARKFIWYHHWTDDTGGYVVRDCTMRSRANRSFADAADARRAMADALRCIGWMDSAGEFTRRLFQRGADYSRSGLTCYSVEPFFLWRLCPSPHRFDRWVRRVIFRAATILRPWGLHPSYRSLNALLTAITDGNTPRLPRVSRMALAVAADVLRERFGVENVHSDRPWWSRRQSLEILQHCAFHGGLAAEAETGAVPAPTNLPYASCPAQVRVRALLEEHFGPEGQDDRMGLAYPIIVAWSRDGCIIAPVDGLGYCDRFRWPVGLHRYATAQVVVRDPATGCRHHITVPPWFGLPLQPGESPSGRVRAAIAWSFGLDRRVYRPSVET